MSETSTRNKSGLPARRLAEIFHAELIEEGLTADVMFDSDLRIDMVLPLPHCLPDYENPCDTIQELIDQGELSELFARDINSGEDIKDEVGFIVVGEIRSRDFKGTVFDEDGHFNMCSGGFAHYILKAFGKTLEDAYRGIINEAVRTTALDIADGLKAKSTQSTPPSAKEMV